MCISISYQRRRPYRISLTAAAVVAVVVAAASVSTSCHAFSMLSVSSRRTTQLFSVGNWISGITNSPPSSSLLSSSSLVRSLTDDTGLQGKELARIYKASKDGWSAVNFHNRVDEKGSCLVVALTRSGTLFGGYNPNGWRSTDDYYNSNAAFLWYDKGDRAVKCPVLAGGNAAIFDYATGGPCFGSCDLLIGEPRAAVMGGFAGPDMEDTSINAGDLRRGRSGGLLAYREEGRFPVRGDFSLVEVEVYCNAQFKDATAAGTPTWWPF